MSVRVSCPVPITVFTRAPQFQFSSSRCGGGDIAVRPSLGRYRRDGLPNGALVGLAVFAGTVDRRAREILDMAKRIRVHGTEGTSRFFRSGQAGREPGRHGSVSQTPAGAL